MNQQIINNNKLIAEFMDYRHNDKPMAFMAANYEKLYHKDWNWLMPVVERIETLGYIFIIQGSKAEFGKMPSNTQNFICENKKESTYKAVVEFIKWYNKEVK